MLSVNQFVSQRLFQIGLERWHRKRKVGCSNPSLERPKS